MVEDDAELREAVVLRLEELGVEVVPACDGVEGLERLAEGPLPGAILLDMRMPRLDGQGFLDALRGDRRTAHIPVITMTGGPDPAPDPRVEARLHKPFDVEDLARILASLCEP